MIKIKQKITVFNVVLSIFLLAAITVSIIKVVQSAALNPGHGWADLDDAPLPVANGGTGQTTATAAFNSLDPLTTKGNIIVHDGTNSISLGVGSNAQVLTADSAQASGVKWKTPAVYNQSVAAQTGFAVDTYLTGSSIAIPANSLQIGTRYHCVFNVVKTAAGLATPIINIRFGTNGTTADTSRGALTWSAQTAAIDEGTFEIWVTFRAVGSGTTAVIRSLGQLRHRLSITGLGTGVSEPEIALSAGFDSTVANSRIGISVNGGTSAAWTVELVQAELENLQ